MLHSTVLGKSIMAYIHHYNIMQNIFTVLKVLCALPIYVLPNPPDNYVQNLYLDDHAILLIIAKTWK